MNELRGSWVRRGFGVAVLIAACLGGVLSAPGALAQPRAATASGLAYSTASNGVVQPQPRPGSCHTIGSGLYSRPDPRCTPGALNPKVRQSTIRRTICVPGWTSTVRPPERITESEKFKSMAAYADHQSIGHYEYDHFVPLELGGATNDRRNLWPEPGGSPNAKDTVENELKREVCEGKITLARAQRLIVADWVALARHKSSPPKSNPPKPAPSPTPAPTPTGCHPTTSSGNCYEPGEYCPAADHGMTGIAGDGKTIVCEDNNGWRWEPS